MSRAAFFFSALDKGLISIIREVARSREVLLISDVRVGPVEDLQQELDADLLVASHRTVDSGGGPELSDRDLARRLASNHRLKPIEAIIYSMDSVTDLAWYEASLRSIPRGRYTSGLLNGVERILDDVRQFAEFGADVVTLCGDAAISDFVVVAGPSPISHRKGLQVIEVAGPYKPIAGSGALHALILGDVSDGVAADRIETWAEARSGMLLVVSPRRALGYAMQASLPEAVAQRLICVPLEDHWVNEFLQAADAVDVDPTLLSGKQRFDLREVPVRRQLPDPIEIGWDSVERTISTLDTLRKEGSPNPLVISLHDSAPSEPFAETRSLLADLAFVAAQTEPMGDLDPRRLRDDVVLIGPRARRTVMDALRLSSDMRSFVYRLTEPTLTTSAVVGLVPGADPTEPLSIRTQRWPHDLGLRLDPALLATPNVAIGQPAPSTDPFDPKEWVGQMRWGTRWRLALPWRWKLLPRAMRGRW